MKRMSLIIGFISLLVMLCANPVIPQLISEIWFNESGHLMVEFGLEYYPNSPAVSLSDIHLVHGSYDATIPTIGGISYNSAYVLDITSLMPEMVLNPLCDTLEAYYSNDSEYFASYFSWGDNISAYYINSLAPGESIVQKHTFWGFMPFKDSPPTPGSSPYQPVARHIITITVADQFGNPLNNVSLYQSLSANGLFPPVTEYTDINGAYADTVYAGKCHVKVWHPQTNEEIFSQYYWLTPNGSTHIPITIQMTANADEVAPVIEKGLHAYPNPFNSDASGSVSFTYNGNAKLSRDSYLRIYDTKGRFIQQIEMNSKGTASWQPSPETASGLYLARLISGKRIVDTATFSIIK